MNVYRERNGCLECKSLDSRLLEARDKLISCVGTDIQSYTILHIVSLVGVERSIQSKDSRMQELVRGPRDRYLPVVYPFADTSSILI